MQDVLVRLYDLPRTDEYLANLARRSIQIRRAMAYEKAAAVDCVQVFLRADRCAGIRAGPRNWQGAAAGIAMEEII